MKFVIIVLSITCLISLSCKMGKSKKEQQEVVALEHLNQRMNKDTISLERKDDTIDKDTTLAKQNLIQGIWAENKNENAIFYIENDSLTYMEDIGNPLYYKLINQAEMLIIMIFYTVFLVNLVIF